MVALEVLVGEVALHRHHHYIIVLLQAVQSLLDQGYLGAAQCCELAVFLHN